jgi:hypothetical protein
MTTCAQANYAVSRARVLLEEAGGSCQHGIKIVIFIVASLSIANRSAASSASS